MKLATKASTNTSRKTSVRGGGLHKNLRINGKRRYRRRVKAGRTQIPNRIDIEDRPEVVEKRARYGDWEADLIEGTKGSGYILNLYERKSRFGQLVNCSAARAAKQLPVC